MKRVAAIVALAAGVLLLAGCDQEGNMTYTRNMNTSAHTVDLPDGRTVLCVYEYGDRQAGLSCDWSGAA